MAAINLDWGALNGAGLTGAGVMDAFYQGQQRAAQIQSVAAQNHALAIQTQQRQATFARESRYRDALATFMTAGRNAGGPHARQSPSPSEALPTMNVLAAGGPSRPTVSSGPTLGEGTAGTIADVDDIIVQGRRLAPPLAPHAMPGGPGWDNVVRADPIAALAAEKEIFGTREQHLKDYQAVTAAAMKMLGGVRDQDSWDRARHSAQTLFESYGVPFPDYLPDDYSPETVRELQVGQLDIDKQIEAALNERKFEWQRQDDLIDNARDDRRVAIQDRGQRDASARGWSADRRAERRYRRGDGVMGNLGNVPNDDLINMLEQH